jgi:hypothetical protein
MVSFSAALSESCIPANNHAIRIMFIHLVRCFDRHRRSVPAALDTDAFEAQQLVVSPPTTSASPKLWE